MNFLQIYEHARYPTVNSSNYCGLLACQDTDVTPNEIKEIYLGLVLLGIPKNHIVQIIEINSNFRILSKFFLPSINNMMLPIVALSPISIKSGDILCHIQLLPISKFLPGKWDKFLIVNISL
jgi:hypothetical protein